MIEEVWEQNEVCKHNGSLGGRKKSWQQVQHAKLYSDSRLKEKGSDQGELYRSVVPHCGGLLLYSFRGRGGSIGRVSVSRSNGFHDQRLESRQEHKTNL